MRPPRNFAALVALAALLAPAATAAAKPPRALPLRAGWEVAGPSGWEPARVPSAFHGVARAEDYGGEVRRYRLRFEAPDVEGYRWALRFEQVRRRATVRLNGRRIGTSIDPYNRFQVLARGLRPGRPNTLVVVVDSRRHPRFPEGWWNWGGITRPVTLAPIGRAHVYDLGLMPDVSCAGPATDCQAAVLVDGVLGPLPRARPRRVRRGGRVVTLPPPRPRLVVRLHAPGGRIVRRAFDVAGSHAGRRRVRVELGVPAPQLWSPQRPRLYRARVALRYGGEVVQVVHRRIGLRSVEVRDGLLWLNGRALNMRGAAIHEDFPGRGPALTRANMDTIVRELEELGANVTRAHYPLSEGLLRRLDRAGIMVWSQAPVWQRDRNRRLRRPIDRRRAVRQVERTVIATRSHPSVIVHSVANELAYSPDGRPDTPLFAAAAEAAARDLDPLLPIAIDLKTRTTLERAETYAAFDALGIDQYFGWYPWNPDFADLEGFLERMRAYYPDQALVMTEFGAEGRPDMAAAPADVKGSYAFQRDHVARTVDLVDRLPFLSGAIHWTLREFEIEPGWRGGAVPGDGPNDDIRHHKGVLTYGGARKPAWQALRDRYARTPLYR